MKLLHQSSSTHFNVLQFQRNLDLELDHSKSNSKAGLLLSIKRFSLFGNLKMNNWKSSIIGKWWSLYLTLLRWSAYDVLKECILRGHQASSTSRHFWWELMLRSTFGHTKFEFYFSRICIILATRNDSIDAARENPALPSSKQLRTGESNYSPHSSRRAKRENW